MTGNETPATSMKFKYPWRPYQARVLQAIDHHLEDDKLHLVAPPGSGKTILGLEIFRRLNQPALVLAPTRVIRDQWVKRLGDFFPQVPAKPLPWASSDLKQPSFFTAATYQSLHAVFGSGEEAPSSKGPPKSAAISKCVAILKENGVQTLILDECHHLKSAWWSSLSMLVSKVPGLTLVSLTGTPPLDVRHFQWQKYLDLCGPIDEEIGVPELVKAGTLCPHQDFIWAVDVPLEDQSRIRSFAARIDEFLDELNADLDFFEHMLQHPWRTQNEKPPIAEMLSEPKLAYAVMVYWRAKDIAFPEYVQSWFSEDATSFPKLDKSWWQILLKGFLFWKEWPHSPASKKLRDKLAKQMRAMGLLQQRELRLQEARPMKRLLSLSGAKMAACLEIYRIERDIRGKSLRQVFLTDFIRDEVDVSDDEAMRAGLGAWPLFYQLVVNMPGPAQKQIALLTGRKSVIHKALWPQWRDLYPNAGAPKYLAEHPDFVTINASSSVMSGALTRWLIQGELHVLVGTRALLGEGWDAPCVNSLILASFIGSFVTTNQMRGRAIRVDRQQPEKWASIWHLVAVDDCPSLGLLDLQDLERRFDTFAGLTVDSPTIENCLERMGLPFYSNGEFDQDRVSAPEINQLMMARLVRGHRLEQRWQEAIERATLGRMIPSIATPASEKFRGVYLNAAVKMGWIHALWLSALGGTWMLGSVGVLSRPLVLMATTIWTALFTLANPALPKFFHALKNLKRLAGPTDLLREMALALCHALCEVGFLKQSRSAYQIDCEETQRGGVFISLRGGDFYEQSLFADSFEMLVKPPANPRYLLEMEVPFWQKATGRACYAVPTVLGARKHLAEILHKHWQRRVGKASLRYTRLDDGKALLLKTQIRTLAKASHGFVSRVDRWQ